MRSLIPALMLAGCATAPGTTQPAAAGPCDAARVQSYLGRALTPALEEAARREAGAATVRSGGPDAMMTMDFRPDRLTIGTDAAGMIVRLTCG